MSFKIKMADAVIEINHQYNNIVNLCKDFIVDKNEKADFSVSVDNADIQKEKELCNENFADGFFECTAIHRKIVTELVKKQALLIHSVAVSVDNEAYIFMAKSGVGKSTHLRQWKKLFGDKAIIVNGDKPMFSFMGNRLYVHGSPWKGKENWGENMSVPVKAMCLLQRGEQNEIRKATQPEIIEGLFKQILVPEKAEQVAIFMGVINRIVTQVPFYIMKCNISQEAAEIAYNGMSKEESK